jgi:hypothetical protein
MLADRPLEDDESDRLGYWPYADALAELIDNPETDTPLAIAISAPWGAGKTTLAKSLERRLLKWPVLRGDPQHVICWFNAWIHDDAPHLGAAFAADVAKAASRFRPWWWRVISPLPGAMLSAQERWRRRALFGLAAFIVAIVLAARVPGVREVFTDNDVAPKVRHAFGARLGSLMLIVLVIYVVWTRLFAFRASGRELCRRPSIRGRPRLDARGLRAARDPRAASDFRPARA